jgi:hypothetical protein
VVKFAASSGVSWTGFVILSVTSWSGLVAGGGPSQLFVGANASGLSSAQLSQIQFVNPLGLTGTFAAKILATGEIVPVFLPPSFGSQPQSQVAVVGGSVTFATALNGTSPFNYQWRFGAAGIAGATSSAVTLSNLTMSQSGSYSVLVTNIAGTNTSSTAQLTIYATAAASLGFPSGPVNGRLSFGVTGVPGFSYIIQSSSNLIDWMPLETNVTPFTFTDTNAVNPLEFYRAVYRP